ncbi:MAG: hypothetical protein UDK34_07600 [Cyanobacteriota bacterium]|nr:hypothetical protein [Cyanobacteriota bacterium]
MIVTNIISAIGNNSSIYPLLVRDCCIEAPSKILIARKENLKESKEIANDATREKIIDEYATSGIWLGGIPMVEYFSDKFISKKGYNPIVNLNLFKTEKNKEAYQGIEYNINKFKNIQAKDVQDAVQDLIKVKNNKESFEKLLTKKFCAATIIPTIIMGFVLPKLNFALTKKIREKKAPQKAESKKEISFTGSFTSQIANLRTVDKMAISDGGLTVGRVTTSRNKDEAWANAFRMIGSMILNFVTPIYIAKGLDKLANKLFNINVNLDPKILADNEFINTIKNSKVELPKSNTEKDLIDFIDNKPQALFSRFAQKTGKVSYLKSGYRDPRKFVDIKDLGKFRNEFENFIAKAKQSKNIENFARKAKFVKSANILANVGISSFLLAGVLPAATYKFIKLTTGSYSDPGLVQNKK